MAAKIPSMPTKSLTARATTARIQCATNVQINSNFKYLSIILSTIFQEFQTVDHVLEVFRIIFFILSKTSLTRDFLIGWHVPVSRIPGLFLFSKSPSKKSSRLV